MITFLTEISETLIRLCLKNCHKMRHCKFNQYDKIMPNVSIRKIDTKNIYKACPSESGTVVGAP